MTGTLRRSLRIALRSPLVRVGGTLAGIAILLRSVDMAKAAHGLRDANVGWATLGMALTAVALMSSVLEWGVLLRGTGHRLSWASLSSWYLQGLFVGQVLPAGVGGDALRAVEVGKVTGHGHALASLAGSRMAGTLGMAAWGVAGAVLLRAWLGPVGVVGACVFVVAMVIAWVLALGADRVVRRMRGHECRWRKRVFGILHPFTGAFRGYRRRPHVLAQCLTVGAAGWGINLLALAFFARALGIDAPWSMFAVAIPVTLLATLAPFSLNGLGLREGVLVGLLAHAGVSSANAGALAVLIDLQMVPFALFGAVLWMRRRKVRAAEAAEGHAMTVAPVLAPEAAAA
ncbi:MAG TPA: lysylphosphatidylglycerol synthase transmembrane domain-containing protein [Candidatus Dormibacteraeota bacterium]|nr:lysylphosphatidylglycerol synthase transmembrane domain-containing protein [Candidatus Dormibacteraeota bacterium]